jgi:hypothetical protein
MTSIAETGNATTTIEHLDDASDCCRDAADTLSRVGRLTPTLTPHLCLLQSQLMDIGNQLKQMRAAVHGQAYGSARLPTMSVFHSGMAMPTQDSSLQSPR